jgi:hypothetical protein
VTLRQPGTQTRRRIVANRRHARAQLSSHRRIKACQQNQLFGGHHPLDEHDDLRGGFAFAQDDFGKPTSKMPMGVKTRKGQRLDGKPFEVAHHLRN